MHLFDECAREKLGMPPEWNPYQWEAGPPELLNHGGPLYYRITGAVAPLKTRGPCAGKSRNWQKMDKSTKRTIVIPVPDYDAWCAAWSLRTGKCIECTGRGQVMARWNHLTGMEYRSCHVCRGTGHNKANRPGYLPPLNLPLL